MILIVGNDLKMIDYYKEIFQYIKKNIFDKDLAHDVTQETFARAIKSADLNQIENERALLLEFQLYLFLSFLTLLQYKANVHLLNFHLVFL